MNRCFGIDLANRIAHEIQLTTSRWFLSITVGTTVTQGAAHGALIAFLLWKLTPTLLLHAGASDTRTRYTLLGFKLLTIFINMFDGGNMLTTVGLYMLGLSKYISSSITGDSSDNTSSSDVSTFKYQADVAAMVNAVFNGLYLFCGISFALVAANAVRAQHRGGIMDRTYKIWVPLLSVCIVLRCILDLIWSVLFKLVAGFKSMNETITTTMIHTLIYGLLSVLVYISILSIASEDNPSHTNVKYDIAADTENWGRKPAPQKNIYDFVESGIRVGTENITAGMQRFSDRKVHQYAYIPQEAGWCHQGQYMHPGWPPHYEYRN